VSAAWVVRSGRMGERDSWALQRSVTGGGWRELPDLRPFMTREQVAAVVEETYGKDKPEALSNYTGQLWALRDRIAVGDLVVMPMKTTKQIALGRVTGGYEYLADESDPDRRHVIPVQWLRTDLPRTAIGKDLLFTLGGATTIFQAKRHDAVWRLEQLAGSGEDPGPRAQPAIRVQRDQDSPDPVDNPEENSDIEQVARDRIAALIQRSYAGHGLAVLTGALLEAEGFRCTVSPPGADGGVDVLAGRGALGLDAPRLVVQVKSEPTAVGVAVINQLQGVLASHEADQALLVAWGGVSKPARQALTTRQFRVRIWDSEDVIDSVLRNYDRLPDDIRTEVPLKRIWVLIDQES
jgi:restriction system protein